MSFRRFPPWSGNSRSRPACATLWPQGSGDADRHACGADGRHSNPATGWQSAQARHEREDFRELVSCVDRGITSILRFLRIGHDAFEITACWGTVLAKGAAHKIRSHPNNFLSGVYYVRTQPGTDTINFHHLRRQTSLGPARGADGGQHRPGGSQGAQRNASDVSLVYGALRRCQHERGRTNQRQLQLMFSSFTRQLSKPLW